MARFVTLLAIASAAVACTVPGVAARPSGQVAVVASQPWPRTFSGGGSRVLTTRLPRKTPLVVTATHNGSANFVIKLVGNGANELLVNEIGHYTVRRTGDEAHRGKYRMVMEADGSWRFSLYEPVAAERRRI